MDNVIVYIDSKKTYELQNKKIKCNCGLMVKNKSMKYHKYSKLHIDYLKSKYKL